MGEAGGQKSKDIIGRKTWGQSLGGQASGQGWPLGKAGVGQDRAKPVGKAGRWAVQGRPLGKTSRWARRIDYVKAHKTY